MILQGAMLENYFSALPCLIDNFRHVALLYARLLCVRSPAHVCLTTACMCCVCSTGAGSYASSLPFLVLRYGTLPGLKPYHRSTGSQIAD